MHGMLHDGSTHALNLHCTVLFFTEHLYSVDLLSVSIRLAHRSSSSQMQLHTSGGGGRERGRGMHARVGQVSIYVVLPAPTHGCPGCPAQPLAQ